jgi:predicted transcriptional regulator of viral defense system
MNFNSYINDLEKRGKCSFTLSQAQNALGKSRKAINSSVEHLLRKGELATPARGFYVIVPPEYQILGCLPAEHFIPYLMEYWECPYYAGLLTAAKYHGATHQAVQVFQVIIEGRSRAPIVCGKVKIHFIANKNLAKTPVQIFSTPKSMLKISTPEGTAMDLLTYSDHSGGLNHIATVLAELQESMKPEKLLTLVESETTLAWKQRLGYILEILGASKLAKVLKKHLKLQNRIDYIPLMSGLKNFFNTSRNSTWKIIENATIESDI